MPRPFQQLDSMDTDEGLLELRRRGSDDFMILVGGRVLMTSALTTSELALARVACKRLSGKKRPRVLIGGLGLGFTLRAALDSLPAQARVTVVELNDKVADWCRGPVASANGDAANDPRVRIVLGDVITYIERVARDPQGARYHAILWDLYVGPERRGGHDHPLYGDASIRNVRDSLVSGGIFGVWSETKSNAFTERLARHGLEPELVHTAGKGLRHVVHLGTKEPAK